MSKGYCMVGMYHPRFDHNIGSALRAADCFGAAGLIMTGRKYKEHGADTSKAIRRMPLFQVDDLRDAIPYGCVPVAVDIVPGAVPLHNYTHPDRAIYIFGPEDSTLGSRVLGWTRDVIYIPSHMCLNVAMAVNVILYDRMIKRGEMAETTRGMSTNLDLSACSA